MSRIGPAQHDEAISTTCVRARFVEEMGALMQVALIAATCCAGPIRSLVVVVVVACCCCIAIYMPPRHFENIYQPPF